jgi:hypothetical protein
MVREGIVKYIFIEKQKIFLCHKLRKVVTSALIVSNYKNTWTKETFLDYLIETLQGDTLQWLKQWEKLEGKQQKNYFTD